MPSAQTLLDAYKGMVRPGEGQMALAAQAQYGPAIKALHEVVNKDSDPR